MILIAAITMSGCRIIGVSSDEPMGLPEEPVSLDGAILLPAEAAPSIQANQGLPQVGLRAAALTGALPVAGADVWIEELPNFPHTTTDQNGKYVFRGLPAGNFRVVASFKKANQTMMKIRSEVIEVKTVTETVTVPNMALKPASKVVSGVLRDADGNFLKPGTVLVLWGEKFEIGQNGTFTSPPLPDDVETAPLTILNPAQTAKAPTPASQPQIAIQFFSSDKPTTVDLQVTNHDSTFKPIGATVIVKKNNLPVSATNKISMNDRVDLSLSLINIERTFPGIIFEWDAGRGSFAADPDNSDTVVWVAPANSGLATISVKISAPQRGYAKVFLPLVVDLPVQVPIFSVTFDSQSGSVVVSQSAEEGARIVEPAAPTRANYTFAGWYKDAGFATSWNFSTDTVTQSLTLYAKWVSGAVPVFRVSFDSQGGSTIASKTVAQGEKITEPTAPARAGYTFAGWFKEAAGTTPWNFTSDTVSAALTLYAKWVAASVPTFSVTFDSQGGSAIAPKVVAQGEKITEPTSPARASYTFAGWFKDAACTAPWNFSSDTVSRAFTLYAKWSSAQNPQFTLSYAAGANGAINGTTVQTVNSGANGTSVTAVATIGYRFVNWSDGRTENPRTDVNVTGNLSLTAIFAALDMKVPGTGKYAWSENAGWINASPAQGTVSVKFGAQGFLSGIAWSENIGWIKFAASAATAPYANNASNNWGVNLNASGKLTGYAWSENAGWINFGATHADAALNQATGVMSGSAWAENLGWIKFSGSLYGVQFQM